MSRHLSPTAQLLRSSRLFSLPQPLPKPVIENQVNLGYRNSDTATTPFPTHQAISTPESSLRRGDWGFKRPLPVRDTSNEVKPFVRTVARLTGQDTIEHITDYETASDHTKTWEKFQEMRIALVRKDLTTGTSRDHKSAFEPAHDYTDQGSAPTLGPNVDASPRWKFHGPSLGQMTQRDFNEFVTKKLHSRRDNFDRYLRAHVTRKYLFKCREEAAKKQQEGGIDDNSATINLGYLNWICQLSDVSASSATVKGDGWRGTWKHYRKRLMEVPKIDGENGGTPNPALLSYLDELSAQNGRENIKEILVQKLIGIPEADFEQLLRVPEPWEMSRISEALSIVIPRASYLSTMMEEMQNCSQQESSVRIANVLVAEWEFFTRYNKEFEEVYLKWLSRERGNVTSTSPLNKLIRDFLDIAPMGAKDITGRSDSMASETFTTHPSAGLSYLQTNSYLDNHPVLGPQSTRTPFDARVLSPRSMDTRGDAAHFGIGGFVVQESRGATGSKDLDNRVAKLAPEADGGVKIALEVPYASVDRWAAVKLDTLRPRVKDAVHIKEGSLTHPILDSYRRSNRAEGLTPRFNRTLDTTPAATLEAKKQSATITNLLGMLNAKKKEQEAEGSSTT
jgi:hypothetical protein